MVFSGPSPRPRKRLPVNPSEEHLKKQAKRRAKSDGVPLSEVQHQLANEYGSKSWPELMHVVETMSRGADQLVNVRQEVEPLPDAARKRDLARVRSILENEPFTRHDLDAALAHCTWYGGGPERFEIARLLLDHGADPDGQYGSGYGPIVLGCGETLDAEGLQFLIEAGAEVTFGPIDTKYGPVSPLHNVLATYDRGKNEAKHKMIDLLLQHGAVVPAGATPPILAIHRGDPRKLTDLLQMSPDLVQQRFLDMPYGNIELKGATLLHCAVEFGENECCEQLLKQGADINARADTIDSTGGQTPIFHAIASVGGGNRSTLEFLAIRASQRIDISVQATFRLFGEPYGPVTPLEYAEQAMRDTTPTWRRSNDHELTLLRSLA